MGTSSLVIVSKIYKGSEGVCNRGADVSIIKIIKHFLTFCLELLLSQGSMCFIFPQLSVESPKHKEFTQEYIGDVHGCI